MLSVAGISFLIFAWSLIQYIIDINDYRKMTSSTASEEWYVDRIKIIEERKIWLIVLACFGFLLGIYLTYLHYH